MRLSVPRKIAPPARGEGSTQTHIIHRASKRPIAAAMVDLKAQNGEG